MITNLIKLGNPTEGTFQPLTPTKPTQYSFPVHKNLLGDVQGTVQGTNLRNSPEAITESITGLHLYIEIKIRFEKPSILSALSVLIVAFKNSICNPQTLAIKGGVA